MCVKVAVHDMTDTNLFKLETSFSKKGFCKYVALGKMNGQTIVEHCVSDCLVSSIPYEILLFTPEWDLRPELNLGFPELNSGYSLREITTRDVFP